MPRIIYECGVIPPRSEYDFILNIPSSAHPEQTENGTEIPVIFSAKKDKGTVVIREVNTKENTEQEYDNDAFFRNGGTILKNKEPKIILTDDTMYIRTKTTLNRLFSHLGNGEERVFGIRGYRKEEQE